MGETRERKDFEGEPMNPNPTLQDMLDELRQLGLLQDEGYTLASPFDNPIWPQGLPWSKP